MYVTREITSDLDVWIAEKSQLNAIYIAGNMGAYLSKPICDKESEDEEGNVLSYGASAMQGWRLSQEVRSETRWIFGYVIKTLL